MKAYLNDLLTLLADGWNIVLQTTPRYHGGDMKRTLLPTSSNCMLEQGYTAPLKEAGKEASGWSEGLSPQNLGDQGRQWASEIVKTRPYIPHWETEAANPHLPPLNGGSRVFKARKQHAVNSA